jgi:hypothetical protein
LPQIFCALRRRPVGRDRLPPSKKVSPHTPFPPWFASLVHVHCCFRSRNVSTASSRSINSDAHGFRYTSISSSLVIKCCFLHVL